MHRPPLVLLLALVIGGAAVDAAWAQDVVLKVVTVKAKPHGETDPELRSLRPRLRRLVGFRSYRMVAEQERGCPWQATQTFRLPGGNVLYLRPERLADQRVVMQVRLLQGDERLVDTDVQLRDHGTMFLGMGRGDGNDGALLIMLKAGVVQ